MPVPLHVNAVEHRILALQDIKFKNNDPKDAKW